MLQCVLSRYNCVSGQTILQGLHPACSGSNANISGDLHSKTGKGSGRNMNPQPSSSNSQNQLRTQQQHNTVRIFFVRRYTVFL